MCMDLDCCHPKCLVAITSFPGNILQRLSVKSCVQVMGCKTLYVCAFYNPNEGDAICLENFERSLQQIGGNTSSHNFLDSKRHKPPWIWLEAQLPISNVSFRRANLKAGWLSWRSWLSLTYNQSCVGVINVLDFFITNNNLIIKTQVIRGISDHDAVFVEGINITATLKKQKRRMVALHRKTDWDALKNTCRLCRAFYCLWSVNKWLFLV